MADQYIQVATDGAGKKIDATELTVNSQTVNRQRGIIADDVTAAALARVLNALPALTDYGLVVRQAGPSEANSLPEVVSANFTRPSNTTAYAAGDLVANSTTAGSVTALSWTVGRLSPGRAWITGAKLKKSGTSTTNAWFRIWLFAASVTVANGDNGAFSKAEQSFIGVIDVNCTFAFTDAAVGFGSANHGPIPVDLSSGQTIYGLIEARGAYTPTSAEVFTVDLSVVM